MNSLFTEQATILLVTLVASSAWLIKKVIENGFDFASKYIAAKQEKQNKIIQKETEIGLIELQHEADRKNQLEDYKFKRMIDRNTLQDGLKVIYILKQLREKLNLSSVSIIVFHNGVAKNYKNFSMRYQETRSVENFSKENYQVLPLSNYYEEITKFEKNDYIILQKNDNISIRSKVLLAEHNVDALIIFPLLIQVTEANNNTDSIMSIEKNGKEYFILGCLIASIDAKSSMKNDTQGMIQIVSDKLDMILSIYEQNSNILS